jgi:hypothetical protein
MHPLVVEWRCYANYRWLVVGLYRAGIVSELPTNRPERDTALDSKCLSAHNGLESQRTCSLSEIGHEGNVAGAATRRD